MELLHICTKCKGKGTYFSYTYEGRKQIKENTKCDCCDGKGQVYYSKQQLIDKLIKHKERQKYLWSILKHERKIPNSYYYNITDDCIECNGMGWIKKTYTEGNKEITEQVDCKCCNGKGYISKLTTKDLYDQIFREYIGEKKQKEDTYKLINEYDNIEKKDYNISNDYDTWNGACIRCKLYNDSIETDNPNYCYGCYYESMCIENGVSFTPINESARKWFTKYGVKVK